MTKYYDAKPPYIKADADKVLCDGSSMTGLGGRVSGNNTADLELWQEMAEEEANAILNGGDEEISGDEFLAMVEEVL